MDNLKREKLKVARTTILAEAVTVEKQKKLGTRKRERERAVSYTHLTLPTRSTV